MKNKNKFKLTTVLAEAFLFIGAVSFFASLWYINKVGDVGVEAILITLTAGKSDVDISVILAYVLNGFCPAVLFFVLANLFVYIKLKRKIVLYIGKRFKFQIFPFTKRMAKIISVLIGFSLIFVAAVNIGLPEYILKANSRTLIFENEYISPDQAKITFPEEKRNLIYIFLESVETTYFSKEHGGAMEAEQIPELYNLALENVNFSHNDGIGGFCDVFGSTYTVAAMVSHTSGMPYKVPLGTDSNEYSESLNEFMPGLYTMGDLLKDNGYYQALMVGSASEYAGRDKYFSQHGTDVIYDYKTAMKDGIIPDGYRVWWGMEDKYLFEYAKKELTEISKRDEPFAFTMLTVDTHFPEGYICSECGNEYDEQFDNVLKCSSHQVNEFINWIKEQDFYENTAIVIAGDHRTMGGDYIHAKNVTPESRRIYNCFINSAIEPVNTKNRVFVSCDMFPSTLAAMGCEIEGERLGMGTNLFSEEPTLSEKMGFDVINDEFSKSSVYYTKRFVLNLS